MPYDSPFSLQVKPRSGVTYLHCRSTVTKPNAMREREDKTDKEGKTDIHCSVRSRHGSTDTADNTSCRSAPMSATDRVPGRMCGMPHSRRSSTTTATHTDTHTLDIHTVTHGR